LVELFFHRRKAAEFPAARGLAFISGGNNPVEESYFCMATDTQPDMATVSEQAAMAFGLLPVIVLRQSR
jgi:hypothetical protein